MKVLVWAMLFDQTKIILEELEARSAELFLAEKQIQFCPVVAVRVDLAMVKGDGFNDLVRAVFFL